MARAQIRPRRSAYWNSGRTEPRPTPATRRAVAESGRRRGRRNTSPAPPSPSTVPASPSCTSHDTVQRFRVSLPAKAEAQIVHGAERAEAAPGVIKAQPRRAAGILDATSQRQTGGGEVAAALLRRHPDRNVIRLPVRLNRVTRPAGDREATLADVLHPELEPRAGARLAVVRLIELRQHGDPIRALLHKVQCHAHAEQNRQRPRSR